PVVDTVDSVREVEVPVGDTEVAVAVIRGDRRQFQLLRGSRTELMRRFHAEPCVFVSESFARRHRVGEGDAITLTAPNVPRPFPIAAIFYDYTRDQGIVYMSRENFARFWHDDRVHSVAVYLRADHRAEEVTKAL